jgi:phosphoglycolate phosphatase
MSGPPDGVPRYPLVIFDFDGTLADSFGWFVSAANELAARHRFRPILDDEVDLLRGLDARGIVRRLGIPLWRLPWIAHEMRGSMALQTDRISLFPGVPDLLRDLHGRGVTLAMVTSNAEPNVRRVLGADICSLFRFWGCGAGVFGKRPKLRSVLRRSGHPPHAALAVGDEIRDLHAARAERIRFAAVGWGYTRPDALASHAPDELFTDVVQIARAVIA